jgi:hypothetical protein
MSKPYLANLLNCPFCHKSDALTVEPDCDEEDSRIYAYHVHCHHCGCNGRNVYLIGLCETHEAAIEAWNDRGPIENGEEEQIDFELTGAEVPNRITLNVPESWFKSHAIRMNSKGKAIIAGLQRR